MTVADALAYAGWLDRTGQVAGARLCTEPEWERAIARRRRARSTRHGNALSPEDANIDETYGKDASAMGPDEVGSIRTRSSPFGLDDMSGNVFEWTTSRPGAEEYVVRGGSYFYDLKTAQLANRNEASPTVGDVSLGFRVCADLAAAL